LAAAVTDREESSLGHKHFAKLHEPGTLPDLQERGLIDVSHGKRSICKEITGIDITICVDGRFIKRHRARASAKIPGIIQIKARDLVKGDMRQRLY